LDNLGTSFTYFVYVYIFFSFFHSSNTLGENASWEDLNSGWLLLR